MSDENIEYQENDDFESDIAIIAMTGMFPDADDVEQFWHNLKNGVESLTILDHEQLRAMGFSEYVDNNPDFISVSAALDPEKVKMFDAAFFGISPREAEIMDPQHRLFLQACWQVFESAGYSTEHYDGRVGVFGGTAFSGYLENLVSHPELLEEAGSFQTQLGTDKDFIATRVSYKMGFTGPSMSVSTLCSSSAVAMHLGRESLLNYQTDMVIAGAVNLSISSSDGLYYQEGGIGADDGHCRAYDERATGTVGGSGLGVIVMKRLSEALADGDNIIAVIKATAVNNDGANKASYTAPSPQGQAEVIAEAIATSGINPETISYIDGHGTATNIGDPIEINALTKAYRQYTDKKQFCGIGSVKTNIGHLVSAGAMASLFKTVLAMQHKQIPASLNFEKPNPKIDFANSPFFVNDKLRDWPAAADHPRRAGVSSFGIGGTNVHMILEEAPEYAAISDVDSTQLIVLSAKTETALGAMKSNLSNYLSKTDDINLADLSHTLKLGRCSFEHKFVAVCEGIEQLKSQLNDEQKLNTLTAKQKHSERTVCFMFSGQGSQYQNMAKQIYDQQEVFKHHVDECFDLIEQQGNHELKSMLFNSQELSPCPLQQTQNAQLSLFIIEYALAKLWMSWGFEPKILIGHSIGEYVAACLAGVFDLEDALKIVQLRGQLMANQQPGSMLSVALSAQDCQKYLNEEVCMAANNGPNTVVLSGPSKAIEKVNEQLTDDGIATVVLKTSHAFHSSMMDGALQQFTESLAAATLNKPQLPLVSNLTGQLLTDDQAIDPQYWSDHLRSTVEFKSGIEYILKEDESTVFVEIGPGQSLSALAKMMVNDSKQVVSSLPVYKNKEQTYATLQMAIGAIWAAGQFIDWKKYYKDQPRKRLALPTYPFDKKPFWVEKRNLSKGEYAKDLYLNDSQEIMEKCAIDDLFESGQMNIDIKLSATSPDKQRQQLMAIMELQKQLKQICSDLSGKDMMDFKVSPLGLVKSSSIQSTLQQDENHHLHSVVVNNLRPDIDTEFVEPESDLQKQLAADWEKALGFKPVGINDNFFELGGHSLIAAALVNLLRQDYDIDIELRELLDVPTVAELAELIETKRWLANEPEEMEGQHSETLTL